MTPADLSPPFHATVRSSDDPTTPARSLTVAMTALRVSTFPSGHSRNPTPTRVNRKCSEVHRCTEVELGIAPDSEYRQMGTSI